MEVGDVAVEAVLSVAAVCEARRELVEVCVVQRCASFLIVDTSEDGVHHFVGLGALPCSDLAREDVTACTKNETRITDKDNDIASRGLSDLMR